jgi:transcriptional regulator
VFIPAYYRNNNISEIIRFITDHPFAQLIMNGPEIPFITHIPVELIHEGDSFYLQGHLSRANPQSKILTDGANAVIVFTGPHSYISSGWYDHVNVPTWNYIAVHVSGQLKILSNEELYNSLKQLVNRYESASADPVRVENIPEEMMTGYMKGIIGFNLSVKKIEGKWKMSQNRNENDFMNIISQLEKIGDVNASLVADEMRKHNPHSK